MLMPFPSRVEPSTSAPVRFSTTPSPAIPRVALPNAPARSGIVSSGQMTPRMAPTSSKVPHRLTPVSLRRSCQARATSTSIHSLSTRENGDFHLRHDSPCIDSGVLIASVTDDLEGTPPGL